MNRLLAYEVHDAVRVVLMASCFKILTYSGLVT